MTATLSEHHRYWHIQNGQWVSCPWDCPAGEWISDYFEGDQETLEASGDHGVRCGSCKGYHTSARVVETCYKVKRDATTRERREAAMAKAIDEGGECEHGLSKALCAGPGHYPMDNPYDD